MKMTYFGPQHPIDVGFEGGGANMEQISFSPTQIVYRNSETGATTTITGTDLAMPSPRLVGGFLVLTPAAGTVTGWTTTLPRTLSGLPGQPPIVFQRTVVSVSDISWSFGSVLSAINAPNETVRYQRFFDLLNLQPVNIDASGASAGLPFLDTDRLTVPVTFIGSAQSDMMHGGTGADWFTPGRGNDTIYGFYGNDMVSFNDATARAVVDLAAGEARIGADVKKLNSIENITGTSFGDLITGNAASNRLRGMGDYDWFVGSNGNDTYDGGTGRDMVAYTSTSSGVTANLQTGKGTGGQASGDSYIAIENLTGSSYRDSLTGDGNANLLRGLGGDDFLYGGGGNDTIEGGAGRDQIYGGAGNDRMTGGAGNDTIDGGAGWDTAIFSGNRAAYTVSTNAAGVTTVRHNGGGADGTDTITLVEVLQFADGYHYLA